MCISIFIDGVRTCKRRIVDPNECSTSRGYPLVQHSHEVLVQPFDQVTEIVQEKQVVVLSERIKERRISFIGGDEDRRVWNQCVFCVPKDFIRSDSGVFVH